MCARRESELGGVSTEENTNVSLSEFGDVPVRDRELPLGVGVVVKRCRRRGTPSCEEQDGVVQDGRWCECVEVCGVGVTG